MIYFTTADALTATILSIDDINRLRNGGRLLSLDGGTLIVCAQDPTFVYDKLTELLTIGKIERKTLYEVLEMDQTRAIQKREAAALAAKMVKAK
jgi:hypothetical protein